MKRFAIPILVGLVGGFVLAVAGDLLNLPFGVVLAVVAVAALAWPTVCLRYVAPRRAARLYGKLVDPDWRPPETAQPATSPVLERIGQLAGAGDWNAVKAHLADDFAMVDITGRRYNRRMYLRCVRATAHMYRDHRSHDQVLLADPASPGVFHQRSRETGRPASGPPLDITAWTRVTLAPCGERVREIAADAVIRVG